MKRLENCLDHCELLCDSSYDMFNESSRGSTFPRVAGGGWRVTCDSEKKISINLSTNLSIMSLIHFMKQGKAILYLKLRLLYFHSIFLITRNLRRMFHIVT